MRKCVSAGVGAARGARPWIGGGLFRALTRGPSPGFVNLTHPLPQTAWERVYTPVPVGGSSIVGTAVHPLLPAKRGRGLPPVTSSRYRARIRPPPPGFFGGGREERAGGGARRIPAPAFDLCTFALHALTHSRTHALTHSRTHALTHFPFALPPVSPPSPHAPRTIRTQPHRRAAPGQRAHGPARVAARAGGGGRVRHAGGGPGRWARAAGDHGAAAGRAALAGAGLGRGAGRGRPVRPLHPVRSGRSATRRRCGGWRSAGCSSSAPARAATSRRPPARRTPARRGRATPAPAATAAWTPPSPPLTAHGRSLLRAARAGGAGRGLLRDGVMGELLLRSRGGEATSWCGARTAWPRTSSPSSWTTRPWGSPTWCAARTCSPPPRGRSSSTTRWTCPRPPSCTCR